jgi:hypothetical protein
VKHLSESELLDALIDILERSGTDLTEEEEQRAIALGSEFEKRQLAKERKAA